MEMDPNKINVIRQEMSVSQVLRRVRAGEVVFANQYAPFWDVVSRSRLVESLLVRIPLPCFWIDMFDDRWVILDGNQRLKILEHFVDENGFALAGLEFFKELENKTFAQLSRSHQRRIEESDLLFFAIRPETPVEARPLIWKRIGCFR
ncbi:MAG: DUF262 domain-containing protein [Firmicutes bacterium]|nr:DUF262 domain-containing protein [Bacillota bacterium]